MFFQKQKDQIEDILIRARNSQYEIVGLRKDLDELNHIISKLVNLKLVSRLDEHDNIVTKLKHDSITCEPFLHDDSGNMTLEFDIRSTPCKIKHEPLYDEDEKLVGMKIKIQWKCVEPC